MRGTSRSGWAAIHIAAERAGIPRPTCGAGIEIEYRTAPTTKDPDGGIWAVSFIGTNPGQPLRYVPSHKLKPSVSTQRIVVASGEVTERLKLHPDVVAPYLADVRRMSKAFGPSAGYRHP